MLKTGKRPPFYDVRFMACMCVWVGVCSCISEWWLHMWLHMWLYVCVCVCGMDRMSGAAQFTIPLKFFFPFSFLQGVGGHLFAQIRQCRCPIGRYAQYIGSTLFSSCPYLCRVDAIFLVFCLFVYNKTMLSTPVSPIYFFVSCSCIALEDMFERCLADI